MAIREDIAAYLNDFRGVLGWNSFTEVYTNTTRPKIEIPLYVKESQIPIRKPKLTEINTIQTLDPGTGIETTTAATFFGAPDILSVQVTGWTITPTASGQWNPLDAGGSSLNYGQLSYNDIITYYIKGRFNRNISGTWQRQDPSYYITPRGQLYTNPIIAVWQPQTTPTMKKQAFDMTLWLET